MPIMEQKDDFAHEIEDDPAWGESWYFVFYDPHANLSLLTGSRIRINQAVSEHSMTITLPDGRLAQMRVERPQDRMSDTDIEGGGLLYQRLEPMRRWRVQVDSEVEITEADGRAGTARAAADLIFDAVAPAIGTDGQKNSRKQEGVTAATASATGRGHFDQAGQWSGWVSVGDSRWELNPEVTFGMRDKSWGPRRWHATPAWRIIFANIDKVTHFGGICMMTDNGTMHRGWVWEDGKRASIANWHIRTELAEDGLTHKVSHLTLTDKENETYEIKAELLRPIHFHMHSGERPFSEEVDLEAQKKSVVISGPTRFTYKGRVGYGQLEYQHLLDETGKAVYPIS
ncbi:MAG: hypothetical protein JWO83_1549 [Caulobacteraceae bacterium]|nr:hypothetical protein [Caulobacteraceae bacterium]